MQKVKLTIAISTMADNASMLREEFYPINSLIDYTFIVQYEGSPVALGLMPEWVSRPDITLFNMNGFGLSRSRNKAIELNRTEYLLLGDDDIDYRVLNSERLIAELDSNRFSDIFIGVLINEEGEKRKNYRPHGTKLNTMNIGRVGSPEIILRTLPIRERHLLLDTNFGLGSTNSFGEEMIFLSDALRKNIKGIYIRNLIGVHDGLSSGGRGPYASRTRTRVFRRSYGKRWPAYFSIFQLRAYSMIFIKAMLNIGRKEKI